MKKLKLCSILLVAIISSFFFITNASAYIRRIDTKINLLNLSNKANYSVVHKQMNIDGDYVDPPFLVQDGEVDLGTQVSPPVQTNMEGFIIPPVQTVTINTYGPTTITYLYEREKYTLTIEDDQYVQTETPSGEYYYGKEIILLADQTDVNGREFKGWSNGVELREYSFMMSEDVTIKPLYGTPYRVNFVTNGGTPQPSYIEKYPGEALGNLPELTNNDCVGTQGSYSERSCTYAYEFKGWYLESTFEHEVDENYVPTNVPSDGITLYAKWSKVYYHVDQETFDGTNMLDSEIALFSSENATKDFIVTFTLDSQDANQGVGSETRAALFANINEVGMPFAGTMFRWDQNRYEIVANANTGDGMGKRKTDTVTDYGVGQTFVLKRENGLLYYSVDGGDNFTLYNDFSNFSHYFNATATFGGEYNSHLNPYRYFIGTMSNMTIELKEPTSYTIKFDANGGTGTMTNQSVAVYASVGLKPNAFVRERHAFGHWNTEPDDSGTSYTDGEVVSGLGNEGDIITLYAQWIENPIYYVEFRANGGSGAMDNQEFIINEATPLNPSRFTKEGYIFESWNTEPDGSGTIYEEGEVVTNLTNNPGETVTLYAQYGKREYHYDGEIEFDGVDDIVDTEINLFAAVNIDKDFVMEFDVVYVDPANATNGQTQPTVMSAKDENYNATVVPGFVLRLNNREATPLSVAYKWNNANGRKDTPAGQPIHYEFTRTNGEVKMKASYDDGTGNTVVQEYTLYNQNNWSYNSKTSSTVTFGGMIKNGVADRFFKGTLKDINVVVSDT